MNYEKIHCVNHIGKNLLIVGYNEQNKWQFEAVTPEGKTVQQKTLFPTAIEAEKQGQQWIVANLET